jgi:hypothetical protein
LARISGLARSVTYARQVFYFAALLLRMATGQFNFSDSVLFDAQGLHGV